MLPNFADKTLTPVSRQHLCPFEISAPQPSPAGRDRSKAMAVYMAGSFYCQHPSMTKSTFSRNVDFGIRMPPVLAVVYSTSANRESRRPSATDDAGDRPGKTCRTEAAAGRWIAPTGASSPEDITGAKGGTPNCSLASITTRILGCWFGPAQFYASYGPRTLSAGTKA